MAEKPVITTVTKVEWVTQGTGKLFPVVHYEPIRVSGCLASKASGKSYQYVFENGIGVGAKIRVARPGNVAPNIVNIVKPAVPEKAKCHWGCDPELLEMDGAHIYCQNSKCPALLETVFERLINTFAPVGFSDKMRNAVMKAFNYNVFKMLRFYKYIKQPTSIGIEGLTIRGERLVTQMLRNMTKWDMRLYQLTHIAAIEFFGEMQAKEIESWFSTGKQLKVWVQNTPVLDDEVLIDVRAGRNWTKRHGIIARLLTCFDIIKPTQKEVRECPGIVCINGKLETGNKKTFASKHITPYGYKWAKTLADATILIDADGSESHKTRMAKKRRIKIIPIKEWLVKMEANNGD